MKNDDVKKEIERMAENRKHHSNTNNPIDFPKIQAGADIHAGDGGYSIGTQEKYEEFAKARNKSLANARIRELAEQATSTLSVNHEGYRGKGYIEQVEYFDKEKFAELIVLECARKIEDMIDNGWYADTEQLKNHFGVKE